MRVVSWDAHTEINDGISYAAYFVGPFFGLPEVAVGYAPRTGRQPTISGVEFTGRQLFLEIMLVGSDVATLRSQLASWFDPVNQTARALIIEDDDGTKDRYLMAVCQNLQDSVEEAALVFVATLVIDDDTLWRDVTPTTESVWAVTATGQTKVVTNAGQADVYPIITIAPQTAKTDGYGFKRQVFIRWRVYQPSFPLYPVDITNDSFNTAALVTAGKMQADGDDLRVLLDGKEVDRWLDGMNTTTTKVWVNMNFMATVEGLLEVAIAATGNVDTIELDPFLSGARMYDFPAAGVLMIDNEAFTYTGKSDADYRFTGVMRATKGTTAAAHSVGATVWWVQHDVVILYGNAAAAARVTNDNYKPMFGLASTNTLWAYNQMGEDDFLRPASWVRQLTGNGVTFYTGDQGAMINPWEEAAVQILGAVKEVTGRIVLYNPNGITSVDYSGGEKWVKGSLSEFSAAVQSSKTGAEWADDYVIPAPTIISTWQAWSQVVTPPVGTTMTGLALRIPTTGGVSDTRRVEVAVVNVTLNSAVTPTIVIGAEQGNYSLAVTITNETTGEAIVVTYAMALAQSLKVDTNEKTVTYLLDNSSQQQALALVGASRRDWLRLLVGANTLRFDDVGTTNVQVTIVYEKRYYS